MAILVGNGNTTEKHNCIFCGKVTSWYYRLEEGIIVEVPVCDECEKKFDRAIFSEEVKAGLQKRLREVKRYLRQEKEITDEEA